VAPPSRVARHFDKRFNFDSSDLAVGPMAETW
jgi:hypothetical protein